MKVLLTCGIGDFIALESFLTPRELNSVTEIHWATRAREALQPLLPFVFPNLTSQVIVRDDFGDAFEEGFAVESAADLPELTDNLVVDWSFKGISEDVHAGHRRYEGSSLTKKQLANVTCIENSKYFVVHPYSENARTTDRDMTKQEWIMTCRMLRARGYGIIVLNKGTEKLPPQPGVEDLTNKLSLLEALEITRNASGFIGASSVFSVLAAKVCPPNNVFIKGHNLLKNFYADIYYPLTPDVVTNDLLKTLPKLALRPYPNEITVNTVQGIGDIFWVYQKLAPHFDKIHLNILCTTFTNVQTRAKSFCKMLPKIGNVDFHVVSGSSYDYLATTQFKLRDILKQHERFNNGEEPTITNDQLTGFAIGSETCVVNYACNKPLEIGICLEDIDPDMAIEREIELKGIPKNIQSEDYLCLFVAGLKNHGNIWTPFQWLTATKQLVKKFNIPKIKLIGAEWDREVQEEIYADLKLSGYDVENYVGDLELVDSIDIIRRSRMFFGFQSGLNIIADNYDVPQLMIYFDHLERMMYSWCKPENRKSKFHAGLFCWDIDELINNLEFS